MWIIPYSTDVHDGKIRLAALQIIGVCLLVHVVVSFNSKKINREIVQTVQMWEEQKVSHAMDTSQTYAEYIEQLEEYIENQSSPEKYAPPEDLMIRIKEVRKKSLIYKLGLVLSDFKLHSVFTSMFTHVGWFHLIGNMILFYVCGLAMEQYWGYWRFIVIYLFCGIASDASFALLSVATHTNMSGTPLVGASGAIAGVMGAFMVTHFHNRVKLFYMVGLWYRGVFTLPSFIYFGFWFLLQIVALLLDNDHSSGVAYSAHIGGFIVGGLLGKLVKSEDTASIVDHRLARFQRAKESAEEERSFPKGHYHMPVHGSYTSEEVTEDKTETPSISVAEKTGWEALERNDIATAREQLSYAINTALQHPEQYRTVLVSLISNMYKKYNQIRFSQNEYYQWAKQLAVGKEYKFAIMCVDMAAHDNSNIHIKKNSILEAARLRIKIGFQLEKAHQDLKYLTSIDPSGIAGDQAKTMLVELSRAALYTKQ